MRYIIHYNGLFHFTELPLCVFQKILFGFKMIFTILGTARQLRSVTRTKIPSFNNKNFSRHLPEHLISLLNNILFCCENRYSFFQLNEISHYNDLYLIKWMLSCNYTCGLSTVTIEYSSACVCVCVSVCLSVCL